MSSDSAPLLAVAVLVGVAVANELVKPKRISAASLRDSFFAADLGGSTGRIVGVLDYSSRNSCDALSKCSWDTAIEDSYQRCVDNTSGKVLKVCLGTTAVLENVGTTLHTGYKAVKSLGLFSSGDTALYPAPWEVDQ